MKKSTQQLIAGLKLGHYTDARGKTGCTVLVCEAGAVAGVDIRGSASGTREIAACQPGHLIEKIHAICIAGGSAFGLATADGVMEYLEQRGIGFDVGVTHVPIVASAIIYDLSVGSPWIRPDRQSGYSAVAAARADRVEQGRVGAGTGATVGKLFGAECSSPGGFGFSSLKIVGSRPPHGTLRRGGQLATPVIVQAFAVVNAFGDVFHPQKRKILAGARRSPSSQVFVDTYTQMKRGIFREDFKASLAPKSPAEKTKQTSRRNPRLRKFQHEGADTGSRFNLQNTTIAVVATDASFNKVQMQKIAQMAQNGIARTIRPAHTMFDGDTVFALSVADERCPKFADVNVVGEVAAEAVAKAIVAAVGTR
jgi:L-aminopeptidase/D-esterase-like protein